MSRFSSFLRLFALVVLPCLGLVPVSVAYGFFRHEKSAMHDGEHFHYIGFDFFRPIRSIASNVAGLNVQFNEATRQFVNDYYNPDDSLQSRNNEEISLSQDQFGLHLVYGYKTDYMVRFDVQFGFNHAQGRGFFKV